MIMKVKEPVEQEFEHLREGQVLFTYLHLAASEELTQALIDGRSRPSRTRPSSWPTAGCRSLHR